MATYISKLRHHLRFAINHLNLELPKSIKEIVQFSYFEEYTHTHSRKNNHTERESQKTKNVTKLYFKDFSKHEIMACHKIQVF